MEIEKLSDIELKAIAYDAYARLQTEQQTLDVIRRELEKRAVQAKNEKTETKKIES